MSDIDYKSEIGMAVAMKSMQLADASFNRYLKENKDVPNPEEIAKMAKDAKWANAAGAAAIGTGSDVDMLARKSRRSRSANSPKVAHATGLHSSDGESGNSLPGIPHAVSSG